MAAQTASAVYTRLPPGATAYLVPEEAGRWYHASRHHLYFTSSGSLVAGSTRSLVATSILGTSCRKATRCVDLPLSYRFSAYSSTNHTLRQSHAQWGKFLGVRGGVSIGMQMLFHVFDCRSNVCETKHLLYYANVNMLSNGEVS